MSGDWNKEETYKLYLYVPSKYPHNSYIVI